MSKPFALVALLLLAASPAPRGERLADALALRHMGHHAAARAALRPLAEDGSAVAETLLGAMHAAGRGGRADAATAAGYYLRAASRGYAPAQLALARALASGQGLRVDLAEAYCWALIASMRGGEASTRERAGVLARELHRRIPREVAMRAAERAVAWHPWAPLDR